ncbi:hypothetical protein HG535_0C05530 [Zygotorulaspora mrakii]|uniref:M-phase inducer phosphatase n=1 Tax=Zygotorulaspora mrakii TaxID=42260 RepID=A0A7H9B2J2_ZYGMR|nr:uncharacterized protein HG535_0C05530 [Zygotorulaspora mrakii]QLG72199.1 hypothetical protein HG535_0C05530 [Zygotorulaspora mrakii]
MVRLQLTHDNNKKDNESNLLNKMNIGYRFNDEHNIFKNIHDFLKPKSKVPPNSDTEKDENMELYQCTRVGSWSPSKGIDTNHIGQTVKKASSLCEDLTSSVSAHSGVIQLDIPEAAPKVDLSDSFKRGEKSSFFFPSSCTSYDSSNSEIINSFPGKVINHDDNDALLPHYYPSRPLRRNSHNSIGTNSGGRLYRSNHIANIKRSRKSLKGSRQSLRRFNSTEVCQKASSEQQLSGSAPLPTLKTHHPRLSVSNIPFYQDERVTSDQFPRITAATLQKIVQNQKHKPDFDCYSIIDCRFDYEFKGGHIANAINISSREELEHEFIQNGRNSHNLLIFHCEFSSYRGPLLASHLRNCDRMVNYDNYPDLYYPDILILDGGYKAFFDEFPELCNPKRYIGMDSSENLVSRDQEMERFRQDSKRVVSRNSSLHKLTSVSSSRTSSIQRIGSSQDLINSTQRMKVLESPTFKYEAPPRLSIGRYSNSNIFGSSDDCSSASRLSIASSPNLSTNKMSLMDEMDNDSCYSFDEGDSTFTTPVLTISTPNIMQSLTEDEKKAELNPVKRLLFSNTLMEEEGEASE